MDNNIQAGEVWARIDGFPDYAVSDQGRVMNVNTGLALKGTPNTLGYYKVTLYIDRRQKKCSIARLVALHHIPNPDNKPQVNHKDGNRKDVNSVSNLEWATVSENMKHAYETGLLFPSNIDLKPLFDAVCSL